MEELSRKMEYFSQLLLCGQPLYYWEFDTELQLIKTSCPSAQIIHSFLTLGGCQDYLSDYLSGNQPKPLILSDSLGLSWIAAFECVSGVICRVHMIGPTFTSDVSYGQLEQQLFGSEYSQFLRQQFLNQIKILPVTPMSSWLNYGLMLHFSVTGERVEISDYNYQTGNTGADALQLDKSPQMPKGGTWLAEQTAMQMIEEGCLDYQKALSRLSMSASAGLSLQTGVPERKMKNSVISFITLATRAAIRGGLDVETAYFIGENYTKNVESMTTMTELMRLNATMYDDFVRRVHKARTSAGISPAIQACCNYIDLHLSEKITLKDLAAEAGYAEYYLAQKFKKEMKMTLTQYIKDQKIRRAMLLLRSTRQSIQDISDTLGFCNPSYFAETFRLHTGMSPGEYRDNGASGN